MKANKSKWRIILNLILIICGILYIWYLFPLLNSAIRAHGGNSIRPDISTSNFRPKTSSQSQSVAVETDRTISTTSPEETIAKDIDIPIKDIPVKDIPIHEILSYKPPPIFPSPIKFTSGSNKEAKAVLVVGGTDGSGTRRVVQILTQLGVTMVSEDPETYDIHADIVGGWPPIVSPVLAAAKTLNYNPKLLPKQVSMPLSKSLKSLLDLAKRDSVKPQSQILAVGGALKKTAGSSSSEVDFGFKAPVAMTLVPWWSELLPHFKFLHVLRDGRDIAFSVNQGPVEKFYRDMYGTPDLAMALPLRAIRLWSDWNHQIYEWAQLQDSTSFDSTHSFGYLAIHSEDLVSEVRAVRFAAISNLAKFVGSSLTARDLCCLAVRHTEFMGSHDRTPKQQGLGGQQKQVSSRYGKWKGLLHGNTALSQELYRLGGPGLRTFGYEPMRTLANESMVDEDGYRCTLTAEECGFANIEETNNIAEELQQPEMWAVANKCETFGNIDYIGADISAFVMDGEDNSVVVGNVFLLRIVSISQ
eukprot:CAMPEP_0170077396 /NCGR_PEP_ID=MMETSP0019_2-20121128/14224_1 /TAXON_ID=98059 /ORGANISM="Dinobryon sp., Strain UTEXLB2267" /LENGTH=528 /DNA_ID=CAMNT_0010289705 /DNA_START=50 /DNA_END=1637 /DNA_ORIENTATION=+